MTDEPRYLNAYVTCGRKAWHLGDDFKGWATVIFDRGNYTEHYTFQKLASEATDADRALAQEYATPHTHRAE